MKKILGIAIALGTLVLSRLLARHAELETPDELALAEQHRWTLQEGSRLLTIARRVGALSMGAVIAANIDRERVRMLKGALGDELYREALIDTTLRLTQPNEIPSQAWSSHDALVEFIECIGATLMLDTLTVDGWIRRRVALKFPRAYSSSPPTELSPDDRQAISAWLHAHSNEEVPA